MRSTPSPIPAVERQPRPRVEVEHTSAEPTAALREAVQRGERGAALRIAQEARAAYGTAGLLRLLAAG